MSLKLSVGNAHLAIFGYGWDDEVIDSGDGGTEDGSVIQDISDSLDYDFGDVDWDAIADEIDIDINDGYYVDEDGTIYTDDDGDGTYTDDLGIEYDGDGDYNPYGYYEDPDGIPYYDFDGDGIYTDEFGNEYDGDGDYHPYDCYVDIDGTYYYDYDGDGIYTDEYGNEYDGNGEYVESGVLQNKIDQELSKLANDEEALYECMTDHGDSEGVPARIIVTNPPDKVEYNAGDTIDFTGIVVCAYSSATARTPFIRQEWEGPRHNQIPFDQLTFPVTTAENEGSTSVVFPPYQRSGTITVTSLISARELFDATLEMAGVSVSYDWDVPGEWAANTWAFENFFTRCEELYYDCAMYVCIYAEPTSTGVIAYVGRGGGDPIGWQQELGVNVRLTEKQELYGTREGSDITLTDRKQKYSGNGYFKDFIGASYNEETGYAYTTNVNAGKVSAPGPVEIPVQWQTDYQEEPYEDTFDITVT